MQRGNTQNSHSASSCSNESLERDLAIGVLDQAIEDFLHAKKLDIRHKTDAYHWFMADDIDHSGKLWLFSFTAICEQLDIDPDSVRKRLFKQAMNPVKKVESKTVVE